MDHDYIIEKLSERNPEASLVKYFETKDERLQGIVRAIDYFTEFGKEAPHVHPVHI
jgi:hypothetical protein